MLSSVYLRGVPKNNTHKEQNGDNMAKYYYNNLIFSEFVARSIGDRSSQFHVKISIRSKVAAILVKQGIGQLAVRQLTHVQHRFRACFVKWPQLLTRERFL